MDQEIPQMKKLHNMNCCIGHSVIGAPFVLQHAPESDAPHVQVDPPFIADIKGGDKQPTIMVLVMVDCASHEQRRVRAQVPVTVCKWCGHANVTIKNEQEHALGVQTRTVMDRYGHKTCADLAPVANHQSVGAK